MVEKFTLRDQGLGLQVNIHEYKNLVTLHSFSYN